MAKWEYRTVDWGEIRKIGSRITGEDFIDANVDAGLNSLGQEGWELVNVYVDGYAVHRSNKGDCFLKRQPSRDRRSSVWTEGWIKSVNIE